MKKTKITLTKAEVCSGMNRVGWAELLIIQLPKNHDGRNSWLLNYGVSVEAVNLRKAKKLKFKKKTQAAETVSGARPSLRS